MKIREKNTKYCLLISEAGTPGPINTSISELNASDNAITIVWAASEGQVSKYRVQVFDGANEKSTTSAVSALAVILFDDMKNGQEYTVNITAESLPFDVDNTVDSDTHSEVIKTEVMRKYELNFKFAHLHSRNVWVLRILNTQNTIINLE